MTTITINEDLPLKKLSFGSLTELLASLEENGLMVVLRELPEDDVTDGMRHKASKAVEKYREDPNSFSRL